MVSETTSAPSPIRPGLLGMLMVAVRPEFRAAEFAFDGADPVFGGGVCLVPSCERTARSLGLCTAHHDRWKGEGRPDLEAFASATDPRWRKQMPLMCCRAPGCGRGVARQGLCVRHGAAWERAGQPDLSQWPAGQPETRPPAPLVVCQIGSCQLWAEKNIPFCHGHGSTWKVNGRPDAETFARGYAEIDPVPRNERIRLGALPPQLKLEIQYALQRRRDERTVKVQPFVVMQVVRFLATCPVTSLLDRPEEAWRQQLGRPAPKDSNPRAFLVFARRQLEDLTAAGGGWDAEYGRDIWRLHNLGFEGRQTLRFDRIPQPWLKELAKRWARWRISTGLCLEASRRAVSLPPNPPPPPPPPQWRHTLGTRMINRDVPQEVVRRILDHDSSQMTGHYARLHDTTVRRHWEQARKVNIAGQTVTLDPEGPLAEAAWAKQRLGRVTQALPNGYCGLPVQKTCPHANACLTCPMFITTPDFLPQHRDHRQQIAQIITAAEARGQSRLAEMNQQVLASLDSIITSLHDHATPEQAADAS